MKNKCFEEKLIDTVRMELILELEKQMRKREESLYDEERSIIEPKAHMYFSKKKMSYIRDNFEKIVEAGKKRNILFELDPNSPNKLIFSYIFFDATSIKWEGF